VYLLDTNIVSRLDPRRHAGAGELVAWIRRNGAHLSLSVITLTELEAGILKLRRDGQARRADEYETLRQAIEADFRDRVLAVDTAVAIAIARVAEAIRPTVLEWKDLIIAATAKVHGLVVLTNNLRHFEPIGIPVLDPLARLPPDAAS
jgi:predicted nucleic acid-binding protein